MDKKTILKIKDLLTKKDEYNQNKLSTSPPPCNIKTKFNIINLGCNSSVKMMKMAIISHKRTRE